MRHSFSRRQFLAVSAVPIAHLAGPNRIALQESAKPGGPQGVADTFPRQPADMVRETVLVAHGNVTRLRELVDAHPALARAAYDWGFGDWEDALGAASHTGNREIAEYLISRGARPTIFSATMMGQLDVVKTFLAAQPGAQRIPGPHSISLLAHAKNGGPAAAAVYEYLDRLGDAGGPKTEPISDEDKNALAGTYVFGGRDADRIDITVEKGTLMFLRPGMPFGRGLYHVGERAFFPMGAAAVRIRFAPSDGGMTLTVHDPDVVLTARRRA
jgi:hypothetical protein